MEFLGQIGIDPKFILAQIVNFLVLVFVLRLLLYKPLLAVFKKRGEVTQKLQNDLADIGKKQKEAEIASRAKLLDAEGRANEIILRAQRTVETFTDASLAKNQEYLDGLLRETKARIEGAKRELVLLQRDAVAQSAHTLATEFLSEKLGRQLHEDLVKNTLQNFEDLASREEDIAFKGGVLVYTAYALPRHIETRLKRLVQNKFGKNIEINLETEPGLRSGMTIRWGGYQLDGSLRGALGRAKTSV